MYSIYIYICVCVIVRDFIQPLANEWCGPAVTENNEKMMKIYVKNNENNEKMMKNHVKNNENNEKIMKNYEKTMKTMRK